jgi:tRNA G18 (ribose-2'-O)-methylase SpoU
MRDFIVICDDLRSLYNVGSVFRTADGAGVGKIYLCGITGKPDNPKAKKKISKVALGAEETVEWEYASQAWRLIDKLKRDGYQIVSLEQTDKSINYVDFKPKFPIAFVIGNEIKGVKKSLLNRSDKIIEISMRGRKESLNVSVAFGIAAYWIGRFKE